MKTPKLGSGKRFSNFTRNLVGKSRSPKRKASTVASGGRKKSGSKRLMLHQKLARGMKI